MKHKSFDIAKSLILCLSFALAGSLLACSDENTTGMYVRSLDESVEDVEEDESSSSKEVSSSSEEEKTEGQSSSSKKSFDIEKEESSSSSKKYEAESSSSMEEVPSPGGQLESCKFNASDDLWYAHKGNDESVAYLWNGSIVVEQAIVEYDFDSAEDCGQVRDLPRKCQESVCADSYRCEGSTLVKTTSMPAETRDRDAEYVQFMKTYCNVEIERTI